MFHRKISIDISFLLCVHLISIRRVGIRNDQPNQKDFERKRIPDPHTIMALAPFFIGSFLFDEYAGKHCSTRMMSNPMKTVPIIREKFSKNTFFISRSLNLTDQMKGRGSEEL
jgi:hypothetical protein